MTLRAVPAPAALLLLLIGLPGCASAPSSGPEPPGLVDARPEPEEPMEEVEPEAQPEAEPEEEPTPSPHELAGEAAAAGRFSEARRHYQSVAQDTDAPPEARADALFQMGLLMLALPPEPDFDGARTLLQRAESTSRGTRRLEITAVLKLLDEIATRDETVRRLTELIGGQRR